MFKDNGIGTYEGHCRGRIKLMKYCFDHHNTPFLLVSTLIGLFLRLITQNVGDMSRYCRRRDI